MPSTLLLYTAPILCHCIFYPSHLVDNVPHHTIIDNLTPGVCVVTATLDGQIVDRRRILSL